MLDVTNSGALVAPVSDSGKRMKLEIKIGTVVGGEKVKPGDVVSVSARDARILKACNKAVDYIEAEKPKRGRKATGSGEQV